ncbi:hypothetical protein MN608_07822 [Microdochium nivale]|nr:hypothetical protein MN608_07822 [Microdochium nivale]
MDHWALFFTALFSSSSLSVMAGMGQPRIGPGPSDTNVVPWSFFFVFCASCLLSLRRGHSVGFQFTHKHIHTRTHGMEAQQIGHGNFHAAAFIIIINIIIVISFFSIMANAYSLLGRDGILNITTSLDLPLY